MKTILALATIILILSAFSEIEPVYTSIDQNSFDVGERLEYKVKFGLFSIADARIEINGQTKVLNGRTCLKIDAYGKTTGMAKLFNSVDDHWGAYVDTEALVPQVSYRNIIEGKYRKNEVVTFNHESLLVETKEIDQKTGKYKPSVQSKIPKEARDIISGFSYLRTIDFSRLKVGDMVNVEAFFDDTVYDMEIIYAGKEKVKTKIGKINAIKVIPVMPDNKLFDGENAITIWLSDDTNKVPLKVDVDMFIGHAKMEIVGFKNLKGELNRAG